MPTCSICKELIDDQFILNVHENKFHIDCLKCVECGTQLTQKCFIKEDFFYCKDDFFKYFPPKNFCLMLFIFIIDAILQNHWWVN